MRTYTIKTNNLYIAGNGFQRFPAIYKFSKSNIAGNGSQRFLTIYDFLLYIAGNGSQRFLTIYTCCFIYSGKRFPAVSDYIYRPNPGN